MSESQVTTPIVPAIKVSTLDGHRIVGGSKPRGGQPQQNVNQDVQIKTHGKMDVQMSAGGIAIKHPAAHTHETRGPAGSMGKRVPLTTNAPVPQRGRAVITTPASPFSRAEIEFLGGLASNAAQSLAGAQLELAHAALATLAKLHETSK